MKNKNYQTGQAMVALLFFVLVGLSVAISSMFILVSNSYSATQTEVHDELKYLSENGIEFALVKLLKNPLYVGETLQIGDKSILVTVNGETTKQIQSVSSDGVISYTTTATISYNNEKLILNSWTQN